MTSEAGPSRGAQVASDGHARRDLESRCKHLRPELVGRAVDLIGLYPEPRSALVPLCHLAQEQDGWLSPDAISDVAALLGLTEAEVLGTASFYDMLHTEPVGKFLISICTNIACMLRGAYELLDHAEDKLGVRAGGTSADRTFTLEDSECIADCGRAPCLAVNHRFFGNVTAESFDELLEQLRNGELDGEVPPHGTLSRVGRALGLQVDEATVSSERAAQRQAAIERERQAEAADPGGNERKQAQS